MYKKIVLIVLILFSIQLVKSSDAVRCAPINVQLTIAAFLFHISSCKIDDAHSQFFFNKDSDTCLATIDFDDYIDARVELVFSLFSIPPCYGLLMESEQKSVSVMQLNDYRVNKKYFDRQTRQRKRRSFIPQRPSYQRNREKGKKSNS